MIEPLPAPDHVVAFRTSGTLTSEDYDVMLTTIDERLARHEKIGMVMDMTDFTDIAPDAMAKDLRYAMGKLGEWSRFPKSSVVTDKEWLKMMVRMGSAFVPQVEVRVFPPGELEAAVAFAATARSAG